MPLRSDNIHVGHNLRPELTKSALTEEERRYEDTDRRVCQLSDHLIALDSRYEYDLNRGPDAAFMRKPGASRSGHRRQRWKNRQPRQARTLLPCIKNAADHPQ